MEQQNPASPKRTRKPKGEIALTASMMLRLTDEQKAKATRNGGSAWIRCLMDNAGEGPSTPPGTV